MEEKKITTRKQKVPRNRTKLKLTVYGALTIIIILIAVFAPYITPYDPYKQDLGNALLPPCREYLLGTDRYGRDMLSRVIMGARSSISSAVLLVVIITVAGSIVGILCGYCQGKLDSFLAFRGHPGRIARQFLDIRREQLGRPGHHRIPLLVYDGRLGRQKERVGVLQTHFLRKRNNLVTALYLGAFCAAPCESRTSAYARILYDSVHLSLY